MLKSIPLTNITSESNYLPERCHCSLDLGKYGKFYYCEVTLSINKFLQIISISRRTITLINIYIDNDYCIKKIRLTTLDNTIDIFMNCHDLGESKSVDICDSEEFKKFRINYVV